MRVSEWGLLAVASLCVSACATGEARMLPDAGRATDGGRSDGGRMDAAALPPDGGPGADGRAPLDAGPPAGDAGACPTGQMRCGTACVRTVDDVTNCGACGNDCTMLPGVDATRVRCLSSSCQLMSACLTGFGNCNGMVADGCEEALDTPAHCGNCTLACSGATAFCTRGATGTYACAGACTGTSPDECGTLCTDVRTDPANCGSCGRACPDMLPDGHATCAAGVCGVACDPGFHDCGGACASDRDPATCGTSCTPCPTPMMGTATCTTGTCGVTCDVGYTACTGACVDTMTSDAHCGGCGRTCVGACIGGVCDTGVRLSTFSGADQTAYIDQLLPMPVVVRVLNAVMLPVAGAPVTFTASPGAVVTPAMATTDAMGRATANVRLGRAVGPYTITAASAMALAPVTIMATATAPPVGTLFPIANVAHTSGSATTTGPATASAMGAARGVAVAADGTVYVADYTYHVVRAITPEGVTSIIAGRSGMLGVTGDLGPATMALLRTPSGLALDAAGGILYIADTGNNRVRAVTLATGIISTIAGGGTAAAPDYGDGAGATAAALLTPSHVGIGPDGALYISDVGHNRIRRVDLGTGIISAWLTGNTTCTGVTLQLYGCQAEQRSCDVAFDASGRAFVSGYFCGSAIGTTTWGIVRRDTDGSLTRVAGLSTGLTADGAAATASLVNGAGTLGLDPAGNLYYVETVSQRVRRIDATQTSVTTVVGTGVAGYGADFVPAVGQPTSGLWGLALDSQRTLYVSETGNFVVRAIWQIGAMTASSARLAIFAGGTQTAAVDAQVSTAFSAQLTDGGGTPLAGLPVLFVPVDEGAGVVATSAATTATGVASVFGRPGLLPGAYRVEARFVDLRGAAVMGSPVTFTVTATAPAAGTIFTGVNVARTTGAVAGPATYGRVGSAAALAAASDGTIYISDRTQHAIWSLSPRGALALVAGTPPTAGFLGDGGPALGARLSAPSGLALDEPRNTLYIADTTNNRVRAINLTTRNISTIAGGGLTTLPAPYGDAGPATAAYIATPGNVSVDAMGRVYVSDTGHNRIRVVDPVLGLIDAWLGTTAGCTTTPLVFYGCGSAPASCRVLFEPDGSAIVSGQICGNVAPLSTTAAYGIVRRATDGTLTHVAGMRLGATTDGAAAPMAGIGGAGWLVRASDGALHYVDFGTHRIRRIDPTANTVSTIAGTGTAGFLGEYVAASTAQLSTPWGILFSGGHMFVADSGNFAVRVIW